MALVPSGIFEMGDHQGYVDPKHGSDEVPIHAVAIDALYVGVTQVTNEQYVTFLNGAFADRRLDIRNGHVYAAGGNDLFCKTGDASSYSRIGFDGRAFSVLDGKEDHPVTDVRWQGAAAYCNWLSEDCGLEPCYKTFTWECDFTKNGFRLPTEAEWEYAARGGRYDPYAMFPWGNEPDNARANWPNSGDPYETGPLPWTTPVKFYDGTIHLREEFNWPGTQAAYQTNDGSNGFGLYDMAGNVWEFCNDWYLRNFYAISPAKNPAGPPQGSAMPDGRPYRVMRGGSWYNGEYGHSRVANRNPSYYRGPQDPDHPYYHVGFRVVRDVEGDEPRIHQSVDSSELPRPRRDDRRPPQRVRDESGRGRGR